MKQILLLATVLCSGILSSQNVQEPDFIGEAIVLKTDNTSVQLEKTTS